MTRQVDNAPYFVTDKLFDPLAEMRWELRPVSEGIRKPCYILHHQIIASENYFIRGSISVLGFTHHLLVAA